MRASLLASAAAKTLWWRRVAAAASHPWSPNFAQLPGFASTARAPMMNSVRTYLLPRLLSRPSIVLSPVESYFGTNPSQAPKSRPLRKAAPFPIVATTALAVRAPIPGTLVSR